METVEKTWRGGVNVERLGVDENGKISRALKCKTHLHRVEGENVERLGDRNVERLGLERYINNKKCEKMERWKSKVKGGQVEKWKGSTLLSQN